MAQTSSGRAPPTSTRCPQCGGALEGPVSGEVQCFLYCPACGERFDPWDAAPPASE